MLQREIMVVVKNAQITGNSHLPLEFKNLEGLGLKRLQM
jgi:hypothetical protein